MSTLSRPDVREQPDPRPGAAYLLGGHSRIVAAWIEACSSWPRDHLGLRPGLVVFLNEIDHSVVELRALLEEDVSRAIRATIRELKDCVRERLHYQAAYEQWDLLCSEANRALPSFHELYPLYNLGRIVGKAYLATAPQGPDARPPDLDRLFDEAQRGLGGYGIAIPDLRSLVSPNSERQEETESVLQPNAGAVDCVTVPSEQPDTPQWVLPQAVIPLTPIQRQLSVDPGPMYTRLYLLHCVILKQLATLRRKPSLAGVTPVWDEEMSTLSWCGRVIRRFYNSAENQIVLIVAFHRANWSRNIPDPFRDRRKLDKTVTDLNKKLAPDTIRFHRDGSGGVRWLPV